MPPDDLNAARQRVLNTDFFALCYLMLANLAYADENNGQKAVAQITTLLPTMPVPQGTVQGKWQLGWGPQVTADNSNLMYAAEFVDVLSGSPVFSAVVIRGTDTQAKPSGIIKQLIEDIDAETQVSFPQGNTAGSKIAQGTSEGLNTLLSFTDSTKRTVTQYLQDFVAANPGAPVVVTGHSLGGCQTTVMAMSLSSSLPAGTKIVPNSFAAPTAGNQAFINLYQQTFPFCPRWFNNIDLVPMAFAGLDGIKQLWNQCNRPAPALVKVLIDGLKLVLEFRRVSYAQQSALNNRMLSGTCQPPAAPTPTAVPVQQVAAEIQALIQQKLSKIPGATLAAQFSLADLIDWVKELLFQHLVVTGYWDTVKASPGVAPIPNPFLGAAAAAGNN